MDNRLKHLIASTCAEPDKIRQKGDELLRLSALQVSGGILSDPLLRSIICIDIAAEMSGESIEKSKLAAACGKDLSSYVRAYNSLKQFLPIGKAVSRSASVNARASASRSPAKRLRREHGADFASPSTARSNSLATPKASTIESNNNNCESDCTQLALKLGCVDLADRANQVLKECLQQEGHCDLQTTATTPQVAASASRKQHSEGVNWTMYRSACLFAVAQVASERKSQRGPGKLQEADTSVPSRLKQKYLAEQSGVKLATFNRLVEKLVAIAKAQGESKRNGEPGSSVPSASRSTRGRSTGDTLPKAARAKLFSDANASAQKSRRESAVQPSGTDLEQEYGSSAEPAAEFATAKLGPIGDGFFRKELLADVLFDFDFDPS